MNYKVSLDCAGAKRYISRLIGSGRNASQRNASNAFGGQVLIYTGIANVLFSIRQAKAFLLQPAGDSQSRP